MSFNYHQLKLPKYIQAPKENPVPPIMLSYAVNLEFSPFPRIINEKCSFLRQEAYGAKYK